MPTEAMHRTATAESDVTAPPSPSETGGTMIAARLAEDAGFIRGEIRDLSDRVESTHRSTQLTEWAMRTAERGKEAPKELLEALAGLGFAWRDIAQCVGVSVPAVKKWRNGERITGPNRSRLAGFVAACDQVAADYMVSDVASWFEMPIVVGPPMTPIELYAQNRVDLVFQYASGHQDPETILDEVDPDWREHYRARFDVVRSGDGELSLLPKED